MSGDDIRFDHEREERIGITEAVFAEGKTTGQLTAIIEDHVARERRLLLTRLKPDAFHALPEPARTAIDFDATSRTAIVGSPPRTGPARIAIVTAGTVDIPPAREAARTLTFHGEASTSFVDIGVAGLWRLLERKDEIAGHPVVLAFAGMEGALFSVLAGLVPGLVIAVPTGNGYGVSTGGRTALDSALASCAPGVVVCNIDNGYGAATAALRALRISD